VSGRQVARLCDEEEEDEEDSDVGDVGSSRYPSDDILHRTAPALQLTDAHVVAPAHAGRFKLVFLSANHSGNSDAHDVMQPLSAPWRKSARLSSDTP